MLDFAAVKGVEMNALKANLRVILQANDTVVAESEDPLLWQRVFAAITGATGERQSGVEPNPLRESLTVTHEKSHSSQAETSAGGDAVAKLAEQLGITRAELEGACSPNLESPYLHLDSHCWEEMKRQTPERGPNAISPISLSATLLVLWFRVSGLGNATQAQAQEVLGTINLRDPNASRGIQRAEWLQSRPGGVIVLNPAQTSRAMSLARSFCTKRWNQPRTEE